MHVEFEDNTWERVLTRWQADFHEKCPTQTCSIARQQKDTDDANKIIEYLDSENPFDVTLHSHDIGIVANKSGTVDMQSS